jgi:hypothetical protein
LNGVAAGLVERRDDGGVAVAAQQPGKRQHLFEWGAGLMPPVEMEQSAERADEQRVALDRGVHPPG